VYSRSGTAWTQQGSTLVGTGGIGQEAQGASVALSADGGTAIVGGYADNNGAGAAWVYTRSGTAWTQQGGKLVGTGASGPAWQGRSVSLSADGNTAIVGGDNDNSGAGAAWEYTRSGTAWTQQGLKLVGTGAVGAAQEGWSVSLSADGSTAIVGGTADNGLTGAAWVYSLSCSPLSSTTYDTITSGTLPYAWNGLTFTGAGSQTAQLLDIAGCDSAATLVLTVRTTGISEITGPSPIRLYPNPNTGTFTLTTDNSLLTTGTYTISDMLGQVIQHQAITSDSQTIDIGAVPAGIYMLSITGTSGIVKFAVMR
jgi:hypothetical protein